MYRIKMLSRADSVDGQGVGSAYQELLGLMDRYLNDFEVDTSSLWRKADLIHVHTINPEFRLRIQGSRTPLIGSVHFIPETLDGSIRLPRFARGALDWYVLNFYRHMHEIVTVNPIFVDRLVELGFDREHVHFLPNHVEQSKFPPLEEAERKAVRRSWKIDTETPLVIGVGQVQPRKGIVDFLKTAQELPEYNFVWAGGFSFGLISDDYPHLKELVENPPANTRFLGIIDRSQLAKLYAAADVMFLPSHAELFPMTILEASSTNTPVILRNLDIYRGVIGENYLCAEDVAGFAQKIQEVALPGKTREAALQECAKINKKYAPQVVAQQWRELYVNLIERQGAR